MKSFYIVQKLNEYKKYIQRGLIPILSFLSKSLSLYRAIFFLSFLFVLPY